MCSSDLTAKLAAMLDVPVIPMVASKGTGVKELRAAAARPIAPSARARQWALPPAVTEEYDELRRLAGESDDLAVAGPRRRAL